MLVCNLKIQQNWKQIPFITEQYRVAVGAEHFLERTELCPHSDKLKFLTKNLASSSFRSQSSVKGAFEGDVVITTRKRIIRLEAHEIWKMKVSQYGFNGMVLAQFSLGFKRNSRIKLFIIWLQLRERARWIKSCAVIGYPSGQDGAILPAQDYPPCPARKISPKAI